MQEVRKKPGRNYLIFQASFCIILTIREVNSYRLVICYYMHVIGM